MVSRTYRGVPYPDDADAIRDIPDIMQELAEWVDDRFAETNPVAIFYQEINQLLTGTFKNISVAPDIWESITPDSLTRAKKWTVLSPGLYWVEHQIGMEEVESGYNDVRFYLDIRINRAAGGDPEVYRTRGRLSTNAQTVTLRAKAMIPLFEDDEIEFWAKQNSSPGKNCKGYNPSNTYSFGNIYRYTTLSQGE